MNNAAKEFDFTRKNILICDTQPVAVEGMRWLIDNSGDLQFAGSVYRLDDAYRLLNPSSLSSMPEAGVGTAEAVGQRNRIRGPFDAVVIDKGLGLPAVMELLQKLTAVSHPTPAVVWGAVVTEAEALRLLQAGARGIVRRTSESSTLLACLRAITSGATWMEDGIFGASDTLFNPGRSALTGRELEVVALVEKGLRNRDIGTALGIQTGTVKIHLKHIFEKTGVRGRYGLAFTGLRNKGSIGAGVPSFTA